MLERGADWDDYDDDPAERRESMSKVTTRDVATRLCVTQATVRRWVARGYITPIGKLGPSNVFHLGDVLEAYDQISARHNATGRERRHRRWYEEKRVIDVIPAKHWDAVITTSEAAKLIKVSPATIRSWIHRGHVIPLTLPARRGVWLRAGDVIQAAHRRQLPKRKPGRRRPR